MPKAYVLEAQRKVEAQKRQQKRIVLILDMAMLQQGFRSRKELAARAGIDYLQLCRRYRGETAFDLPMLISLADTLRLDAASRAAMLGCKEKCRYDAERAGA